MPFLRRKEGGMSARTYSRRELMMDVSIKYIELESCIFPRNVIAILDIIGNDNKWTYEGAVARHSGTATSNSNGHRLVSFAKIGQLNRNTLRVALYTDNFNLSIGGYFYTSFTIPTTNDYRLDFYCTANSVTLNGETKTASTSAGATSTYRLMIGSGQGYGVSAISVKFWYLKAWQNGVLKGDYVPAIRREDKKIGILNKVNGTFIVPTGGDITT